MKTHLSKRPAGATAIVASLLVLLASQVGLELSEEAAVAIVGGLTMIASALSPRIINSPAVQELLDNPLVKVVLDGEEIAQAVAEATKRP